MEVLENGGITSPRGFSALGYQAGIKAQAKDLAVIVSDTLATAAGVFTTNVVKAAPVVWSQRVISAGRGVRAIVVNSGNANACTGPLGMEHAISMAETTADALSIQADEVLVASTGVIGVSLPIETVCRGIRAALETKMLDVGYEASNRAAEAIMTTDTRLKTWAVRVKLSTDWVTVGGMAKGSGMIHPNMATMLAFVTTDARIAQPLLAEALRQSVDDTYNMISVDGDTSTNDSVIVLASGLANHAPMMEKNADYELFLGALQAVNQALAQQIIRDGEGATKFLSVTVNGAQFKQDARVLAKSIITSNLVKTAFFGEDANWGRILAAMGYSGVEFDPARIDMRFQSQAGQIDVMEGGEPVLFDEERARSVLHEPEVDIVISLGDGLASATAWGCDLSYEYVRINGSYRS